MIVTINGMQPVAQAGVVDAHNHAWIDPVPGGAANAPVLNAADAIAAELVDFRRAGGGILVDCQPGGCGRNGERLRWLSESSGVKIVAVTGFHLSRYYPPGYWLFRASQEEARKFFLEELSVGLAECLGQVGCPKAGLVKIACEATLEDSLIHLMEAAAAAAVEAGAALAAHTERGAQAEHIALQLADWGFPPSRLILYHIDKRSDFALHRELAQEGILLEYDTFYRQKYAPQTNLWPLLEKMVANGLDAQVAIGTDMAEASMWSRLGSGPGLTGLFQSIIPNMEQRGFGLKSIRRLTGENIASRLAVKDNCP